MKNEPPLAWYCVRSQPKHEQIAAAHLRQMQGVEAFCPRLRLRKMTRRGPVWFVEALFPNYLFARFDPQTSFKEITYAPGVTCIVRFGDEFASIPESVIEDLRQHMGATECKVVEEPIREGADVIITEGCFQGLVTVVTQLLPARERVRVLIEFLGQSREVEVSKAALLPKGQHFLAA